MTGKSNSAVRNSVPVFPTSRPCLGLDELEAMRTVFESRWLGTGALTQQFQQEIAKYLGVRNVVAVNSGTAALHIAMEALGIGRGDEVIVPSFTFISTIQAIVAAGAQPVFCDVELESGQMDVTDALARKSTRTRAILPVHYGGSTVDMGHLIPAAQELDLRVVEDAAHAFGSNCLGRKIGTIGDITCFSFDPIKNITCGTGGVAVTNDDRLAKKLRLLSNVGLTTDSGGNRVVQSKKLPDVTSHGYRYRMVDLNAAIGLQQLKQVDRFCRRKIEIARRYDKAFDKLSGIRIFRRDWNETFPFLYAIRVLGGRQAGLAQNLLSKGIGTAVHFTPNHFHSVFANQATLLPVTEQLFSEVLTLPFYVDLSDEDVEFIIGQVCEFFKNCD